MDEKWKRRERALGRAVIVWAVGVSVLATVRPEWTANWLVMTEPPVVAGVIMISIGILGAIFDHGSQAYDEWIMEESELTEVPWDE